MANRTAIAGVAAFSALVAAGCAAQLPQASDSGGIRPAAAPITATVEGETYTVSKDEAALDCRKLTGRIMIRIEHLRDATSRNQTSTLSRSLQSVVTPVLGGTSYGLNASAQAKRDRAQLAAYNKLIEAKGCKPIDIDAEIAKRG